MAKKGKAAQEALQQRAPRDAEILSDWPRRVDLQEVAQLIQAQGDVGHTPSRTCPHGRTGER